MSRMRESVILAFSAAVGATSIAVWHVNSQGRPPVSPEAVLNLASFARPNQLPSPPDNPQSPTKVALGARLFHETGLSGSGTISCATCHDPRLAFADGAPLSAAGATSRPLARHTPSLWNLAWAPVLYWDGRAAGLEEQARFPMTHPDEMAGSPELAAERLQASAEYRAGFVAAFPGTTEITGDLVLKALAAYERSLVSPPTRFDAWVAGSPDALDAREQAGYRLFTGKARCVACHSGFAFTDHAFHDIGLPGDDRGRGAIVGLAAVEHAFKTPTLRELAWTAPYMHDGSLVTLDDVVRHYERGGVIRASRSPDMPRPFTLSDNEREELVAFIETLSSETPPKPSTEPWIGHRPTPKAAPPSTSRAIRQRDRTFAPGAIKARRGEAITILNDDTRTHNVRIVDPRWVFNSGAQEPGESVVLRLDQQGRFEAHCAIHPTMRLRIEVD